MKKLTSLQILMVMGLGLSSSSIFCSSEFMDMDETVVAELELADAQEARDEVLADLTELYPAQAERIITDEVDLESTFNSVRNFVNKKNKEIESLSQQAAVSEADIARLAIELADAQTALTEAEAKNNVKNKKSLRQGQPIKDALMKAQQNLKRLSNQAVSGFVDFGNSVIKNSKKVGKVVNKSVSPKKSKAKKSVPVAQPIVRDNTDEAIAMMDDQLVQDEVIVQTTPETVRVRDNQAVSAKSISDTVAANWTTAITAFGGAAGISAKTTTQRTMPKSITSTSAAFKDALVILNYLHGNAINATDSANLQAALVA